MARDSAETRKRLRSLRTAKPGPKASPKIPRKTPIQEPPPMSKDTLVQDRAPVEVEKLREALEPFAAVADDPCLAEHPDS